jgi:DNA polymerase-3 subunit gamma/tau
MSSDTTTGQYTVVARRYRPQAFGDLIGQGHVVQALSNAINSSRVGHAYLFTGARGVGKTSSARIFAKCLNCETGPTTTPCNECDICSTVSVGEDVDVLEIDGASNRGIDEIRQLRSNANVRPSRSRYKIYIIDEVHMLTQAAFNALLKTLEEPPEHVKFIFCTTDPQKIPITVLSRCQRFDFSPVKSDEITNSLKQIATDEGVEADEAALALLARRANGSMRDSQSLLEQLLSFCGEHISTEDVNQLLGTADIGMIAAIAEQIMAADSSQALAAISAALNQGVDSGQLAQQLLGYFRDLMAVKVGCDEELLLFASIGDLEGLRQQADSLGLEKILSVIQVLDTSVVRMQHSLHSRTLLEVATVRACTLDNLDSISDLVNALSSGEPVSGGAKPSGRVAAKATVKPAAKKNEIVRESRPQVEASPVSVAPSVQPVAPVAAGVQSAVSSVSKSQNSVDSSPAKTPIVSFDPANVESIWSQALARLPEMTREMAGTQEKVEFVKPNTIKVSLPEKYNQQMCMRADRLKSIENAVEACVGQPLRVEFFWNEKNAPVVEVAEPKLSRRQLIRQLEQNTIIKNAIEVFDGEVVDFKTGTKK